MAVTEPIVDPALAALEAAASALRADLAARGVPADELPEAVVLALVAQQERINQLHAICRALHGRLERVENTAAPLMARTLADSRPGERGTGDISAEEYRLRSDRLWAQAEHARSLREDLTPLGTPLSTMYPPEAPRFRHDCSDCVFLGRSADGAHDLYFCSRTRIGQLVARHGDQINAIHCTIPETATSLMDLYPHLAEAYRRAVARGLVGGPGEGG